MTAITTKEQRIQNITNFIDNFSGSPIRDILYLWIAKSDFWDSDLSGTSDSSIEIPIDSENHKRKIFSEIIGMKRIFENDFCYCVPTVLWITNTVYSEWDDLYQETAIDENGVEYIKTIYDTPFYVINSSLKIYKCLKRGSGVSTSQPTHTTINPLRYPDGYVWHYVDAISVQDSIKFYNSSFCPIRHKTEQAVGQDTIAGGIFNIIVENEGSGYSLSTTVTISGDGTGATATPTIVGGKITKILINVNPDNTLVHGTGYNIANVIITDSGGGTGASARAVLSPIGGHGYDPVDELGAFQVEIAIDLNGDEEGKFTTNDYRKIGLIKNPLSSESPANALTAIAVNCLKYLEVSNVQGGVFEADDIITGGTSGAISYIDQYDSESSPARIYFHQNEKTNWVKFQVNETITAANSGVTATIGSINDSEYEPFTGNIIFMEHRAPITRTPSTKEDIRLVIQF